MTITLEQVKSLRPCYGSTQLSACFPKGKARKVTLKALLALPHGDARWLVSRLLKGPDRAAWAMNCATRAKGYVENAKGSKYAAAAAAYAAAAAAAYAAAAAAAYAAAYAAAAAEHKLAMEDAIKLLK
jgi:hypothetical protein